ncbi:hypothetical protein AK812_SmicGene46915, partial [Symbiodinium microadriaticum]
MSEPASQTSAEPWGVSTEASSSGVWPPQGDRTDWAFAAVSAAGDGASDTDSATSSDHDEPLPVEDLQGLSTGEVDEYLFGQYQAAKKRWRRYSGKPVRALRRVIRRKGKGKGKQRSSYLNIDSLLQQSAYFKGKGKGGTGPQFVARPVDSCVTASPPIISRSIVSTVHSWRFPDLRVPAERSQSSRAAAQDPTMSDDEDVPDAAAADAETSSAYMHQAEPLDAPTTPSQRPGLDDDEDADVFMSPNAYPWWPVPSHQKATHAAAEPETAYHSNVRLADGRVGLLVDPGSYGNLVGEQSVELDMEPKLVVKIVSCPSLCDVMMA